MESTTFQICPRCRTEFQPWATECSDCGSALVTTEQAPTGLPGSAGPATPPPETLACLARGGPWELRELAEALGKHGLSTRIGPYPPPDASGASRDDDRAGPGTGLGLYVAEQDHERAVALHQQLVRESSHAEPEPSEGSADADGCPACGAALAADAEACAACGLEFPPLEG